jgi:hypothetical protein
MSCPNCIETYNKHTRKESTCPKCTYKSCTSCVKLYLLGSTELPNCMNCKILWSDDYLRDILSNSWITKDYASKRKNLIFDIEKSLIPSTIYDAELYSYNEKMKINKDIIFNQFKSIKLAIANMSFNGNINYNQTINNINNLKNITNSINFFNDIDQDDINKFQQVNNNIVIPIQEVSKFIKKCPENDCNGYLSSQYKCGLCKCKTCPHCFDIITHGNLKEIDENEERVQHVCKEENVLSAELIKKETKSCPKCGTSIFKIAGCDQMWCTHCNTGFGWISGKIIENGNIHNPHFFQWQQQNNQNQVQQHQHNTGCIWEQSNGGDRINWRILGFFDKFSIDTISINVSKFLSNIIRSILHIMDIERNVITDMEYSRINKTFRILYILKHHNEANFKKLCLQNICNREFNKSLNMLFDMLKDTTRDMINSINFTLPKDEILLICKQIENLLDYFNTQIIAIYTKYKRNKKFSTFEKDGHIKDTTRTINKHTKKVVTNEVSSSSSSSSVDYEFESEDESE